MRESRKHLSGDLGKRLTAIMAKRRVDAAASAVSGSGEGSSAAEGAVGEGLLTVEERDKVIAVLAATGAALAAAAQELTALAEELRKT